MADSFESLSKIQYSEESAIPTTPEQGVEYAITELIGYGDLDANLQEQIDHMGNTGPQGPTGSVGPTGPTGAMLNPKGNWQSNTNYVAYDVVYYSVNGSSYMALKNTYGAAPPYDSTKWMRLVSKGDTGATGPTGPTGPGGPVASMTQSAYDALETKDANTLYVIVG